MNLNHACLPIPPYRLFTCRWGDSNPHSSRHMHLKHACLPFHHIDMVFYHFKYYYEIVICSIPSMCWMFSLCSNPLLGRYSIVLVGIAPRMKRHRLQLVRIFITDIIVGLSLYRLVALLGLYHIDMGICFANS